MTDAVKTVHASRWTLHMPDQDPVRLQADTQVEVLDSGVLRLTRWSPGEDLIAETYLAPHAWSEVTRQHG